MMYDQLAVQALDVLHEFGECWIVHVADTDGLRQAVRREARRRKVKIISRGRDDYVVVVATEKSVLAQAYNAATEGVLPDMMEEQFKAARDDRPPERLIDASARFIDADEVT